MNFIEKREWSHSSFSLQWNPPHLIQIICPNDMYFVNQLIFPDCLLMTGGLQFVNDSDHRGTQHRSSTWHHDHHCHPASPSYSRKQFSAGNQETCRALIDKRQSNTKQLFISKCFLLCHVITYFIIDSLVLIWKK